MRVNFQRVSIKVTRRWVENGKRRQETRDFWQSVSPFNIDKRTGLPKTESQIRDEIVRQAADWKAAT